MDKICYDVAVIGAGASGLMLAAALDVGGCSGIVLEGTSCVGSKLLMSGGGRCNITHGGSIKDFVAAYGDAGSSLRRCLYRHSNLELISRLEDMGVKTVDEDGRIFPARMKAKEVRDALVREAMRNKWHIEIDAKVSGLREITDGGDVGDGAKGCRTREEYAKEGRTEGCRVIEEDAGECCEGGSISGVCISGGRNLKEYSGRIWEIDLKERGRISARNVVIATGGITYPETGSDGSMFDIIRGLGIDIKEPRPALAPLLIKGYPYTKLAGTSLKDAEVMIYKSEASRVGRGDEVYDTKADPARKYGGISACMKGDLLFTHEGLSGPVILNISKHVASGDRITVNYNKSLEELPKRMQRILQERVRGDSGDVKTKKLAALLKKDEFIVKSVSERGMVSAGGAALEEMDMSSMRNRKYDNLYIIGEALDADGITGGYNLQMCWSTACTCADHLRDRLI